MIKVKSDRGITCFDETILQVLIEESTYGNSKKATIVEHKLKNIHNILYSSDLPQEPIDTQ